MIPVTLVTGCIAVFIWKRDFWQQLCDFLNFWTALLVIGFHLYCSSYKLITYSVVEIQVCYLLFVSSFWVFDLEEIPNARFI